MPLNFQQLYEKIHQIGQEAPARRESLDALQRHARELFTAWADRGEALRDKVERARQQEPTLRCAVPSAARLDGRCDPPPGATPLSLIAADGSQITPDRHAAVLYSLVNVGAVSLRTGSGEAPEIHTDSLLLYDEEIYTETGMLSVEAIELQRDIAERRKLLELARQVPAPVLALTDGPVELWGAKGGDQDAYRRNLEIHKSILSQLQEQGVIVAGYVDKPGADLVVRTLEIALLSSDEEYGNLRRLHPLRGVTDRWLFAGLLEAGQRSAVFGLQSVSASHYTGSLALGFFYLNVGSGSHPALVRVEIPRWVADDGRQLDLLHGALLEQCQVMGARPYPYILHRAHEVAVVKLEEKEQIGQMLELELRRAGSQVDELSPKQSAKDLAPRRTR